VVVSDSRLDNREQLLRDLGFIDRHVDAVGDGELLHAVWQRWGEGCADRLRGDFAFVIWNPAQRRLFCARDPMGVRPFYFHHEPGRRFVFASSTEAVLAHGEVSHALDEGRLADALVGDLEGIDPVCTFYTAIQRLPPAHTLQFESGRLTTSQYWHPLKHQPVGLPTTEAGWIAAQRDQLEQAVRLRLRSQYPVGSMLSGGLDSSSVVALASGLRQAESAAPFPVFSAINSLDPACAETAAIRTVLAATSSVGHLIDLKDIAASAPDLVEWLNHLGEPFDGTMPLIASLYAAAGRNGVRSLMDGVPADCFFVTGGFDTRLARRGRLLSAWRARRDYQELGQASPLVKIRSFSTLLTVRLPESWRRGRRRRQEDRAYQQDLVAPSLIDPDFAERVNLRQRYRRLCQNMTDNYHWSADGAGQSCAGVAYITAALERYERVAAHFGVEPRPPFTDRELIEFQAWVPWEMRVRDGRQKWILRQAVAGLLPEPVAWRKGKEHLGWKFSCALMRSEPSLPARAWQSPYLLDRLNPGDLDAVREAWQRQHDGKALEKLQAPTLLALWLADEPQATV
jgi:asparagine synthase (glutamine-hydrolysing)